jgi:hypothetical protein
VIVKFSGRENHSAAGKGKVFKEMEGDGTDGA